MSTSSIRTPASLLPDIVQLSRKAGEAIMAIYQEKDLGIEYKADNSPLTRADLASHHCIEQGLSQLTPDIPVLSEESDDIRWEERQHWSCYWLVDPLDGTKEFVKRNGEFTVNIALIKQGKPVLGVVYSPVKDWLYTGAEGLGAHAQYGSDSPVRLKTDPKYQPEIWRIVGSRSHGAERLEKFCAVLPAFQNVPMGSSLKLCLVAAGKSDLYVRFGPTGEWDTAAAQAVVEQAGGCVLDGDLKPLRYNQEASLLNPEFVVCQKVDPLWAEHFSELAEPTH
ncbi:3'(2'),5'-bisphosphate nucleotidase CysQ [Oceanospirillum linum]|uniref:3'(2'),5'-bisphosphate nucleotidase CysQ n=1 Tax=Oceanospirillum linum TaxID=966 RepID=A0A1T1HEW4_OCELI|nr:3'(2'),5'-bisphosphate nucleotidase CysQ [Oceanospirillum linum]OOV88345.1 3'(2'),5'-bisphosphate nucleotidase [Oceanospirillum linum]SEF52939.1 3'(2'),5'-bisphosphate nucleotidase [Oleiphilus messinensis]SMP04569.1 3'(2'),5'-bisphosphate nucleotidase [Oceanospirillum linum]